MTICPKSCLTARRGRLSWLLAVAGWLMLTGPVQAQAQSMTTPMDLLLYQSTLDNTVAVLPNGNIVVADPNYNQDATHRVGAVYLYDGRTKALISTLTGRRTDDQVGNGGITVLANGNYVVRSPNWNNGAVDQAGAATSGNGTTGVRGRVSPDNSLVSPPAAGQKP